MEKTLKLFMLLIGCTPKGRITEQHDVFFGIAGQIEELIPQLNSFWPEAKGKLHIDVWREVSVVDNFLVEVITNSAEQDSEHNLYFLNLGGYKTGEFEEYHYKMLTVAPNLATAVKKSKKTAFYKHCGFKGAVTHIDEKYGIDIDDSHKVVELLNSETKLKYQLKITELSEPQDADELHIGYLKLKATKKIIL